MVEKAGGVEIEIEDANSIDFVRCHSIGCSPSVVKVQEQ